MEDRRPQVCQLNYCYDLSTLNKVTIILLFIIHQQQTWNLTRTALVGKRMELPLRKPLLSFQNNQQTIHHRLLHDDLINPCNSIFLESHARFKGRISHVSNLMQMRKIYFLRLFVLDSAHVKCGV